MISTIRWTVIHHFIMLRSMLSYALTDKLFNSCLGELFTILKPFVQLHRLAPRARRRSLHPRLHRPRSTGNGSTNVDGNSSRPQSRFKRSLSSLSFGGLGRSKSRGRYILFLWVPFTKHNLDVKLKF